MVPERARQLSEQLASCSVEEQTSESCILESPVGQTLDVHVREITGQLAEVSKNASRNTIQRRDWGRIVDDSVPEVEEELAETSKDLSRDRDQQRAAEDVIGIPTISFAEKIVEVLDTQTRGKMQQGVNSHIQHVVDSVDGEDHAIQRKINQVTKHIDVPSLQIVEKTVENTQLQIVEISSRVLAASGEDPFSEGEELDHGVDRPLAGRIRVAGQESIGRE